MEEGRGRCQEQQPGTAGRIRVWVLDDQQGVQAGLGDLLCRQPGIQVVGEAAAARAAVNRVTALGLLSEAGPGAPTAQWYACSCQTSVR